MCSEGASIERAGQITTLWKQHGGGNGPSPPSGALGKVLETTLVCLRYDRQVELTSRHIGASASGACVRIEQLAAPIDNLLGDLSRADLAAEACGLASSSCRLLRLPPLRVHVLDAVHLLKGEFLGQGLHRLLQYRVDRSAGMVPSMIAGLKAGGQAVKAVGE